MAQELCSVHGESGCFDCMVGGSNPTTSRPSLKVSKAPTRGVAVSGYAEVTRLMRAAEQAEREPRADELEEYLDPQTRADNAATYGWDQSFSARARRVRAHYEPDGAYDHDANLLDQRIGAADNHAEELAERAEERAQAAYERAHGDAPILDRAPVQPYREPITERQLSYLSKLIREHVGHKPELAAIEPADLAKWEASRLIDELVKLPFVPAAERPAPVVVAPVITKTAPYVEKGYYAIATDIVRFYYVSERGSVSVQASDDFHRLNNYITVSQVKELIALDPRGAQELYGQLIGKCGVCGRTLTDEESRAIGVGPVCREKGVA